MVGQEIEIIPFKLRTSSASVRHLFVKRHVSREIISAKPDGRTLVVLNVPPLIDESHLINTFSPLGAANVIIQATESDQIPSPDDLYNEPSLRLDSYRVAYLVFENEERLSKLLNNIPSQPLVLFQPFEGNDMLAGVKMWAKMYNDSICDPDQLRTEVFEYMQTYDERVEQEKKRAKESAGVEDDEGWVTVSKHGKKKVFTASERLENGLTARETKKQEKRDRQIAAVGNFYSYKHKEGKMSKIMELRKKFDEDKRKIAEMKASRRFKPY